MAVKPIPEGYHSITPYFVVDQAEKFIDFTKRAFDARELYRMNMPDGKVMHAELEIGDSRIMVGQSSERWKAHTCSICLYMPDCDAVYQKALDAGATSAMQPENKFYGDRSAGVDDPFGNHWYSGRTSRTSHRRNWNAASRK